MHFTKDRKNRCFINLLISLVYIHGLKWNYWNRYFIPSEIIFNDLIIMLKKFFLAIYIIYIKKDFEKKFFFFFLIKKKWKIFFDFFDFDYISTWIEMNFTNKISEGIMIDLKLNSCQSVMVYMKYFHFLKKW